jgi:hypothetical protein
VSDRLDVRRMLLKRGWAEGPGRGTIRKNAATWAVVSDAGDGFLGGPSRRGGEYCVDFPSDTPARVIVAACEAAAGVR